MWISNNQAPIIPSRNEVPSRDYCLSSRKKYLSKDKEKLCPLATEVVDLKKNETKIPKRLNKESSEKKARTYLLWVRIHVPSWQLEFVLKRQTQNYLFSCLFCSSLKWKLPYCTWLSACNAGDLQGMWVWSLGQEDPLEKEIATHFSILDWKILWTEEPGRL